MKNDPETGLSRLKKTADFLTLKCLVVLAAIGILCLSPILAVLSSPIFLFRYLVSKMAKSLRPDLGEMVTAPGVAFACDDIYSKPRNTIITRLTFTGSLNLQTMRDRAVDRLIEAQFPNGEVKYAELKQYLTQWMGFNFWKTDPNFDIENHVNLLGKEKDGVYSDPEIQEVMKDLVQKPWKKGRPLWELLLVHNCQLNGMKHKGTKTVVLLRTHHTLGDGYSIFSLLREGLIGSDLTNPTPTFHNRNNFYCILNGLFFPIRCAYEIADSLITPFIPWISIPFSCPANLQANDFNMNTSNKISLLRIKEVMKHFRVSFASVVLAATAGALRDILIRKGIRISHFPYKILLPMPVPRHSQKLINHMGFGVAALPLQERDPIKRMEFCNKEYQHLKKSAFLAFSPYWMKIFGSYFPPITRVCVNLTSSLMMLTNFPGGLAMGDIEGESLLDTTFIMGPVGDSALTLCALSCMDSFRISPVADASVMSKEDVEALTILFQKHFELLYNRMVQ